METDRNYINSLAKGLNLLMTFTKAQPKMSLTEVARRNNMNLPTTRRYLHTLVQENFLVKDDQNQIYQLTPKVLRLGSWVMETMGIREIVRPYMRAITKEYDVTTHCAILEDTEVVTVERLRSSDVVNLDITTGSRLPVYCTSLGKAILAFIGTQERDEICNRIEFKALTPYTITDRYMFIKELESTKARGYAIAVQELSLGLKTMAVPIFDKTKMVEASFGVSYPVTRSQEKDLEAKLIEKLLSIKNGS